MEENKVFDQIKKTQNIYCMNLVKLRVYAKGFNIFRLGYFPDILCKVE